MHPVTWCPPPAIWKHLHVNSGKWQSDHHHQHRTEYANMSRVQFTLLGQRHTEGFWGAQLLF